MTDNSHVSGLGTAAELRDPNYTPPLSKAIPLGIQHVLAMFASNITPAIIIAFAAGFGFGSPDAGTLVYLIQMSLFFAGVATLIQTIGFGPIGARLPIVQGTSFAFLPIMIPAMAGAGVGGLAGLMAGVIVGGIFHFILGFFIGRIRFALPPLVTGLIVLMIGLALMKVGIEYAAGGVPAYDAMFEKVMTAKFAGDSNVDVSGLEFGSLANWFVALVVIGVTLWLKFFTRGFIAVSAVLVGLIVGYIVAYIMHHTGMASFARGEWFAGVGRASWFQLPNPFRWGLEWNWAIIIGMCLMAIVSAIETVGDVSGITKGGAGREATDKEIQGATFADGLGTAIAGIFGGLPNTSFSQNVGLISMTGVMSRHVVTIGAIFLIVCGLIPKVGAIIGTIPVEVLGGGVIIMFGMVAAAGINMLSDVNWSRRNMIIFATALGVGLGLQLVPEALQQLGGTAKILLTSGLLPAAFIAIVLNLVIPDDEEQDGSHETQISGLGSASVRGGSTNELLKTTAPVTRAPVTKAKAAPSKTRSAPARKSVAKKTVAKKAPTKKVVAKKAPAKKAKAKTKAKSNVVDHLELISGIGPKINKALAKEGITSLKQVVAMSKSELATIAKKVKAPGDLKKNDWGVQAKALLAGKAPRHAAGKALAKKLAKK